MIRSALMNVMTAAAIKAGRGLKRDFGEVENLVVSVKGPGDFVSAADRKAEKGHLRGIVESPARLFLPDGGKRRGRRLRSIASLDHRSSRRHHQLSCTACRSSPFRSGSSARASSSRASSTIPRPTTCSSPSAARAPGTTTDACASPRSRDLASALVCLRRAAARPCERASALQGGVRRDSWRAWRRCAPWAPPRLISRRRRPDALDCYLERGLKALGYGGGDRSRA